MSLLHSWDHSVLRATLQKQFVGLDDDLAPESFDAGVGDVGGSVGNPPVSLFVGQFVGFGLFLSLGCVVGGEGF